VCLRCRGSSTPKGWKLEIFSDWGETGGGLYFLGKYGHVLFGIAWIGLLYFFNFVQVPAYAEMDAAARSEALRKVTWRALWWFRFAALATFVTGVLMLGIAGGDFALDTAQGSSIYMGALLGTTMFLNVWGVIWRAQKVNIGSANAVAAGGQADPRAPEAAKRAGRASRVNTFFSIPMLWFMLFTAHFAPRYGDADGLGSGAVVAWIILLAVWAVAEASALGLIGGLDNAINKLLFDDHRNTIIAGLVFWLVMVIIGWELAIGT
jgi:uncharacterized membrane protein